MDSQFSLELLNASTSRDELGALRRGQAALKSAIDAVLPAPAVHRLVADTQVASDVLDAAAGRDKVQHPLTKLRGVTASSHAVLPCLGGAAAWRIPIIRLQEIQGALYDPAGHTTLATDNTNRPYTTPNFVFTYYLDGSLRSSQDATYSLAALYSYDGSGNRVGRAEPVNGSSGRALTTYTYNDAGKMVSMTSVATNTLATTLSYDLDGNLTQENDPNQGVTSLRYNHDSTLYSSTLTNSPYTLASWIYAYDGDYRITSQTFSGLGVGGVTPVQGTASYAYDGAGRISYLTLPGQSGQTVSWDHDGNRLTYQGVTYAYNMDDSIASAGGTSFTYFPTGTRRTDAAHFYCFDGYDRLFRATALTDVGCNSPTISYAYEGLDRQRAHSEGSGTTFMEYDGLSSTISAEYLGGGPSGAGTVYALAGSRRTAVGSYASGGAQPSSINYLADDGMGNISTAVTTGGSMACTAWSDAWGVPMSPLSSSNPCNTGSTLDTSFYTGSRRDQITGDYQFGVRTYDPNTGSFLEPDTYLGSQPGSQGSVVSDPLTMNRYVYVNGDPLNLIDPSGHMEIVNDSGANRPYVDFNILGSLNNYGGTSSGSTSNSLTSLVPLDLSAGSATDNRCLDLRSCGGGCLPFCAPTSNYDLIPGSNERLSPGFSGCSPSTVVGVCIGETLKLPLDETNLPTYNRGGAVIALPKAKASPGGFPQFLALLLALAAALTIVEDSNLNLARKKPGESPPIVIGPDGKIIHKPVKTLPGTQQPDPLPPIPPGQDVPPKDKVAAILWTIGQVLRRLHLPHS